jgi:UDP-N-acetyl-D-mannosaminuronate dehydrogenase
MLTTVVVIGLGEVGNPLYWILKSVSDFKVYGYDANERFSPNKLDELPSNVDFLHVAYPYTGEFVNTTLHYVDRLTARNVIIHSTVMPGTTRLIHGESGKPTAYSPVRGKHPNIKRHLMFWSKWVSSYPEDNLQVFTDHLKRAGFKVKTATKPETLELAKLFETAYRAVMIAAWQEIHRLSHKYDANLGDIAEFIAEVQEVLRDRPIYYPDHIGGHCLIPNTEILDKIDPDSIWRFVLESNRRREEELKDEGLRRDVEAVKKVSRRLTSTWYYE